MVAESATLNGLMPPSEHNSRLYAITYDVTFRKAPKCRTACFPPRGSNHCIATIATCSFLFQPAPAGPALVMRNDLVLRFLQLHQLTELVGLACLSLADNLGVRLKQADQLSRKLC